MDRWTHKDTKLQIAAREDDEYTRAHAHARASVRTHTHFSLFKRKSEAVAASPSPQDSRWLRGSLNQRGWFSPSLAFSLSKGSSSALRSPCYPGNKDICRPSPGVPPRPGLSAQPTSRPPLLLVCHKSSWSLDTLQPALEKGYLWVPS